jgi:hypothetical protein
MSLLLSWGPLVSRGSKATRLSHLVAGFLALARGSTPSLADLPGFAAQQARFQPLRATIPARGLLA